MLLEGEGFIALAICCTFRKVAVQSGSPLLSVSRPFKSGAAPTSPMDLEHVAGDALCQHRDGRQMMCRLLRALHCFRPRHRDCPRTSSPLPVTRGYRRARRKGSRYRWTWAASSTPWRRAAKHGDVLAHLEQRAASSGLAWVHAAFRPSNRSSRPPSPVRRQFNGPADECDAATDPCTSSSGCGDDPRATLSHLLLNETVG